MKIKLAIITLMMFSFILSPRLIAGSGVDININLPLVEINDEPEMAVIEGTNIYFIYGNEHDYFFYGGYWWRSHDNRWYRARHYNGKWKHRKNKYVPAPFLKLSPGWRNGTHSQIKYHDMKKNWKKWDKEKHWDKKQNQKKDKENSKHKKDKSGKDRK